MDPSTYSSDDLDEISIDKNIDKNAIFGILASVRAVINSYSPKTAEAKKHLDRGVNYRYFLIKDSVLMLHEGISKIETSRYEIAKINIAFNSIYVNIRGVLDNLAWILRFDVISGSIDPKSISFSSKKFLNKLRESGVNLEWISEFSSWFQNLSLLRDPIAHRLPLYIPPGLITDSQDITAAQKLATQKCETMEGYYEIDAKIKKLRKFHPIFIVDDAEKGVSYPLGINAFLVSDLDNLVKFSKKILDALISLQKSCS